MSCAENVTKCIFLESALKVQGQIARANYAHTRALRNRCGTILLKTNELSAGKLFSTSIHQYNEDNDRSLCWQCEKHSFTLRSTNMSEEEKFDNLRRYEERQRAVQVETSFYSSSCDECSRSVCAHFTTDSYFSPPLQGCQFY